MFPCASRVERTVYRCRPPDGTLRVPLGMDLIGARAPLVMGALEKDRFIVGGADRTGAERIAPEETGALPEDTVGRALGIDEVGADRVGDLRQLKFEGEVIGAIVRDRVAEFWR